MEKKRYKLILFSALICFIIVAGSTSGSYSQCIPDTINCIDEDEPGQICPDELPVGTVGEEYKHYITILAPESGNVGQINIRLYKVRLESIDNLPPGIEFNSETMEFYPNEAYCVSLTGIPVEAGTYDLTVAVTPFISLLGIPFAMPVQKDSTSVSIIIEASSGVNSLNGRDFALIDAYPNPFMTSTRIGFLDLSPADTELRVFNMLGKQVYHEIITGSTGRNYFQFTGAEIPSGFYLYIVSKDNRRLRGRLIKSN